MADLSHLLPSKEKLEERASVSREVSLLRQFMDWMDVPPAVIKRGQAQGLSTSWFHAEYPGFPFVLATARLGSSNVQDFFERPTRTDGYKAFMKEFSYIWKERPCALFFKSTGFTSLALFSSPVLGQLTAIALRVNFRDGQLFLSTMRGFCEAYTERSGSLGS